MSGFNFGKISNVLSSVMDTDFIDIKRNVSGNLEEIYSNIPCHISYNSTDNPDPNSIDTKPIVQSITVNMENWVDVRNDDFIVAKKMDNEGNILEVYSGRCGNPSTSQCRKKIIMQMQGTESIEPTPTPPKNPVYILVKYLQDENSIKDDFTYKIETGSDFEFSVPEIEGYDYDRMFVDGVDVYHDSIKLENVESNHEILIYYRIDEKPLYMRMIVNGLFTKNDGTLENGYHLYRKVDLNSIVKNQNVYTIRCDNFNFIHEDNGKKLSVTNGSEFVLFPSKIFIRVVEIVSIVGNEITFKAEEFEPDESKESAYNTGWYDG